MSEQAAKAFIVRVRSDEAFAQRLNDIREDPEQVRALLAAEGVDATPEEIRDAFLDEFGDQLTEEQLAAVSGGLEGWQLVLVVGGSAIGVAAGSFVVGAAAAAAAI